MTKTALAAPSRQAGGERRVNVLDGWRAVSVGMVIVSHILLHSNLKAQTGPNGGAYVDQLGKYGVIIFFLISGFVICRGLLSEEGRCVGISLGGFYVRRSFRILPPLLIYVCAISALSYLSILPEHGVGTIWRAMSFTCDLEGSDCAGFYGAHTWSLSIEEQFYLVFPLLFIMAAGARKTAILWLIAFLAISHNVLKPLGMRENSNILWKFIPISLGVAGALHEQPLRRWALRLPGWLIYVAPLAAYAIAPGVLHNAREIVFPISLLLGAALLLSMVRSSGLTRLLSTAPMLALGRASYGIYLWQQLVVAPHSGWGVAAYAAAIAACVVWALLSFRFIEQPLIRVGARLSRSMARPARTVADPATAG
jgi:peptidoglycan/LPS O-acetylase OafA/YrhL